MLFTAAVAVLNTAVRFVEGLPTHALVRTFFWGLSFVVVGFVVLWSVRCYPLSLRRVPVALAASVTLGFLFAWSVNADTSGWVYVVLTMLLYPAFLSGSLTVVRWDDNRLLRGASGQPNTAEPIGETAQVNPTAGQVEFLANPLPST
jgi:hypothetical protein